MNGFDLSTISDLYVGGTQASAIYYGSNLIWPTGPHDYSQDYFTIECIGNSGTLRWKSSALNFTREISYSTDKINWTTISSSYPLNGTVIANLTKGDKVYLKGTEREYATGMSNHTRIWSNVKINVYGNLMSLRYGDNFKTTTPSYWTSEEYIFEQLFSECPIEDASNLIFPECACDYCYDYMFNYCTSLLYPPKILPATNLQYASYCYRYMFRNCNKMTTSPYLPNAFSTGTSYQNMFNSCSSLKSITCLSEYASDYNNFNGWTTGVSATGTFTKKAGSTWPTGTSGIPSGWTVVEV